MATFNIKNKILLLFIISLFVLSCSKNEKNEKSEDIRINHFNDTVLVKVENPKIAEYQYFVSGLDSTDVNSVNLAMEKYKVIFSSQSKGLCDTVFVLFQNLLDTIEINLNNQLANDTIDYAEIITSGNIPLNIKELQLQLQKNGFKLVQYDGLAYIEQQRKFVLNNFSDFLSETFIQYLTEIEKENREGFSKENKISISPQLMVDRIIWYEDFIKNYPNFVLLQNCQNYKKAYLTYLLQGYGDTKLFVSKDSKELSEFFLAAYKYLLKKYPNSETAELVKPYYIALTQKLPTNEIMKKYYIKGLIYDLN